MGDKKSENIKEMDITHAPGKTSEKRLLIGEEKYGKEEMETNMEGERGEK